MDHSSVRPSSHGSAGAFAGFLVVMTMLTRNRITPTPIRNAPMELTRFNRSKSWFGKYVTILRCMPINPRKCCTKNVSWKPIINVQNVHLPSVSLRMRPNIFGHQ
ncbi:hypothetical protein D1872_300450 [compost metagenome]